MITHDRSSPSFFAVGLAAILLLDVAFKLAFSSAMASETSLQIAENAWLLSENFSNSIAGGPNPDIFGTLAGAFAEVRGLVGFRTVSLILPISLLYVVFGINDSANIVFPLLSSLLLTAMIYKVTENIASKQAGLLASFLWVIYPLNIRSASSLSLAIPFVALLLSFMFLVLQTSKSEQIGKRIIYLLILFGLVIVLSARPVFLAIVLLFPFLSWLDKNRNAIFNKIVSYGLIGWGLFLIAFWPFAKTTIAQYQSLLADPMSLYFLPLTLLAYPVAVVGKYRGAKALIILFGLTYTLLPFETWLGLGQSKFLEYTEPAAQLWIMLLLISMSGVGLSEPASFRRKERWLSIGAYLVATVPVIYELMSFGNLTSLVERLGPSSALFLLTEIAGGLAVILILTFPAVAASKREHRKTSHVAVLLAMLSFVSIRPTFEAYLEKRSVIDNSQAALSCLERQPQGLPVLAQNRELLGRMRYLSEFQWLNNGEAPVHQYSIKEVERSQRQVPTSIEDSYVLLQEGSTNPFIFIPYYWIRLGVFGGESENQIILYGVAGSQSDFISCDN